MAGGLFAQLIGMLGAVSGSPTVGPGAGGSRQELQSMGGHDLAANSTPFLEAPIQRQVANGAPSIVMNPTMNIAIDGSTDQARITGMIQTGVERGNQQMLETLHAQGFL
jgi:hypothetical protein